MDEETFKLFQSFDFENSQHFQSGWTAISKLIDPQKKDSEYLRAQAFFFTRNVKSFDYEMYLKWRNMKQAEQVKFDLGKPECDNGETPGDSVLKKSCSAGCSEYGHEETRLSLAELADLIQSNQPIPGVISLDVKPSNAEPTPSTMTRKLKPWEMEGGDVVGSVPELITESVSNGTE